MAARHYTVATIMAMLFSQDLGTRVVKATTQALKNAPAAARTRNLRLRSYLQGVANPFPISLFSSLHDTESALPTDRAFPVFRGRELMGTRQKVYRGMV